MSSHQFAMGVEGFGTGKPRNKRRFGDKAPRRKEKLNVLDRIRCRRRDDDDDKYLDDFDDDLDLDDEDEAADYDEDDAWSFEDEDDDEDDDDR